MSTCRYSPDGYLIDAEHKSTCNTPTCDGCLPCEPATDHGDPLKHCAGRKRCTTHLPPDTLICPRCISNMRDKLGRIEELALLMHAAAIETGRIDSEALNLAGPTWDQYVYDTVRRNALHAALRADNADEEAAWAALAALPDDDPSHPLTVLGWWDIALREDWDQPTGLRVTVPRSVAYLTRNLDRLAQDRDQDWARFAAEIGSCLAHLESVLCVARRAERGAPCPLCSTTEKRGPALVRTYRETDDLGKADHSGASDWWGCPDVNEHWWKEAEYRLRVGTDYLATADRLTAKDITTQYGIPTGSIRAWAALRAVDGQPLVHRRGKSADGITLYDVADVLAVKAGERRADTG